jgi:hypothetical protein
MICSSVNRDFFIQSPYTAISSPDFELSFGHLFRGEITGNPSFFWSVQITS